MARPLRNLPLFACTALVLCVGSVHGQAEKALAPSPAEELVAQFRLRQRERFLTQHVNAFRQELGHFLGLSVEERAALARVLDERRPHLAKALEAFEERDSSPHARLIVRKALHGTREAIWDFLRPDQRQKLAALVQVREASSRSHSGERLRSLWSRLDKASPQGGGGVDRRKGKRGKKGKRGGGRKRRAQGF